MFLVSSGIAAPDRIQRSFSIRYSNTTCVVGNHALKFGSADGCRALRPVAVSANDHISVALQLHNRFEIASQCILGLHVAGIAGVNDYIYFSALSFSNRFIERFNCCYIFSRQALFFDIINKLRKLEVCIFDCVTIHNRSRQSVTRIFQQSESSGLICRRKQGLGKPVMITLNYPSNAKLIQPKEDGELPSG